MPGGNQLKAEVLAASSCSLCGACLNWCPYLKNLEDKLVMVFDCTAEEGRCYEICPRTMTDWGEISRHFFGEVTAEPEIGTVRDVYKAKSIRAWAGQQDGGVVSSLVSVALSSGMNKAALLTGGKDGLTPSPFVTFDPSEVAKAAGSRFLASPGLKHLNEAAKAGESLIVVSRPCQVQALRKMQYKRPSDLPGEVTVIGLFCMWSLSWDFRGYLKSTYPGRRVKKVTIPQHGVKVFTDGETVEIDTETVRQFVRQGCRYCLDLTSELADISVGALESEAGYNTVIVRSERGQRLVDAALKSEAIVLAPYPPAEFERLKAASHNKKFRALKAIRAGVSEGRLIPFIDMDAEPYVSIEQRGERKVTG